MGKNYVGDVGLAVELDTGVDLAGATGCTILVRQPDGEEVEWSAAVSGTKLVHVTASGDLPLPGVYRLHAAFTLGGWSGLGECATLTIYDKFGGCA